MSRALSYLYPIYRVSKVNIFQGFLTTQRSSSSSRITQPAAAPMKPFDSRLILLFLIIVCLFSESYGNSIGTGTVKAVNLISPHFKLMRKLGGVDIHDYHDAGPNPSHDPGKGRGGSKVGNFNP